MTNDFNTEIKVSADVADVLRDLDKLIDKVNDTGNALQGAGVNVNKLDRQLNTARKSLTDVSRGNSELAESAKKANSAIQEQIDRIRKLNQETRALADARKQLRSNLDTNLSYIPNNGPSPRVGSSFGNIVDQDDKRAQQASRSYLNLSTAIDQAIDSKEREGRAFGAESRARWQQLVTDQKAAEKATRDFEAAQRAQESQLIRSRYALYDVATTYAAVAAATLGAVTAAGTFATQYESAFTEIERTTLDSSGAVSQNIESLRTDFLELSEQIPLTYQELTKIGSLGAQLGIAEQDLTSFTETVAQFSRLSGVSAEESALAFGRIGELLDVPATEYRNLGSAIAYVATESAATDAQIISLTKELAAAASGAGFSAAEVVGLGGALASLGVAPERARGALSTYFGTLNQAVAEGGEKLRNFAIITGTTTQELESLVTAGEGEEVLRRFISGLNDLDNVAKTTALDELGLSQLRVEDTFRRLGENVSFVTEQLDNAENAYENGTFLGDAFAVVLDDVASQFQLLKNSIGRFLSEAGQPLLEFLRVGLPVATDFVEGLADFASTDLGQQFFAWATAGLVLVGAVSALRTALALATASAYALQIAQAAVGGAGVIGAIRGATGAVTGLAAANAAASTSAGILTSRMRLLGAASLVAIGISFVPEVRTMAAEALGAADSVDSLTRAILDLDLEQTLSSLGKSSTLWGAFKSDAEGASKAIEVLSDDFLNFVNNDFFSRGGNFGLSDIIGDFVSPTRVEIRKLDDALVAAFNVDKKAAIKQYAAIIREVEAAGGDAAAVMAQLYNFVQLVGSSDISGLMGGRRLTAENYQIGSEEAVYDRYADQVISAALANDKAADSAAAAAEEFGGMGSAAEEAAEEIRTLTDYGNDLASVFGRAYDLRFGTQLAVDEIADQWDNLADRIREARMELDGLVADRNVKQYFLAVADAYGDELRAGTLRAEIAEINEKIADTQADASTELQGGSKAARQNRKTLSDLAKTYEDYIVQLAESGADQATLNAAVARSEREFTAQARSLGFSNAQLKPYIDSFRGLKFVIDNVPRNVTVKFSADPAIQAMREFSERARIAAESVERLRSASGSPLKLGTASDTSGILKMLNAQIALREGQRDAARAERLFAAANEQQQAIYALQRAKTRVIAGYASGGFTGRGGKYEPAGIVHKGEYVVPKSQVNQSTGLPYADALGSLKSGSRPSGGYASGGFVTGSMGIMELGPKSLGILREAIRQEVVVAVDSREIARASARGSAQITREGGRLNG